MEFDYRHDRWNGFKQYYKQMILSGDCDPAYPALNYICDRFELNREQRYWVAFLYATNYCVPTTFYIYNEFPDFENIDINRMETWWKNNKSKLYFQSDRVKVKNFNKFIESVSSYQQLIGNRTQHQFFMRLTTGDREINYLAVYEEAKKIYYFGRFSLFNYLEALYNLTNLDIEPTSLDLSDAESCRNGLCYALKEDNMVTLHHARSLKQIDYNLLNNKLIQLKMELTQGNPDIYVTFWNIETVLCAYKKLFWKKRYLGYYIDRMQEEINIMQKAIPIGICWQVLWDFRNEFFNDSLLGEKQLWSGIRKNRLTFFDKTGRFIERDNFEKKYKDRVVFKKIGEIYEYS